MDAALTRTITILLAAWALGTSASANACAFCTPLYEVEKSHVVSIVEGTVATTRGTGWKRQLEVDVTGVVLGHARAGVISVPIYNHAKMCCRPTARMPTVPRSSRVRIFLDGTGRPLFWAIKGTEGDVSSIIARKPK